MAFKKSIQEAFFGTRLGEILEVMSFAKSVPKGLLLSECKQGVGDKNLPICYIPKLDPIQEALKKIKIIYFKLILPLSKSEMSVAQWASGTHEQFLLHVCTAIHACKQMELDLNVSRAQEAVSTEEWNLEVAKEAYAQVCIAKKKKAKGNKGEAAQVKSELLHCKRIVSKSHHSVS
jgi:hypothetical protein